MQTREYFFYVTLLPYIPAEYVPLVFMKIKNAILGPTFKKNLLNFSLNII